MRVSSRRRHHEDEEESAFVSMTDLTVSFLFIIMILLAYSASRISKEETVPKKDYDVIVLEKSELEGELAQVRHDYDVIVWKKVELEDELAHVSHDYDVLVREKRKLEVELTLVRQLARDQGQRITDLESEIARLKEQLQQKNPLENYMSQVADLRRQVLAKLQRQIQIDFPDLQVVISEEMDALRFKGDGLFKSAQFELEMDKRRIVERLAMRLNELLPCYTLGSSAAWRLDCNGAGAIIEAVQIEGHTDSKGTENDNMTLATNRANATFFAMKNREPELLRHLNSRQQPVMSVAGYGAMRPIASNATEDGRATNRRIDLRIIMYTPQSSDEIEIIRNRLRSGVAAASSR